MSSFVGKVKNAVKKRNSRSGMSGEFGDGETSGEHSSKTSYEAPGRSSLQNTRDTNSRKPDVNEATDKLAEMNLNDRNSQLSNNEKSLPPVPGHNQSNDDNTPRPTSAETIPPRRSSLMKDISAVAAEEGSLPKTSDTRTLMGHGTGRSTDVAPNDPSPSIPHKAVPGGTAGSNLDQPSTDPNDTMTKTKTIPADLTLPEGFSLKDSTDTDVTTHFQSAVTQETIRHEVTEVTHPAIERDIHVHHEYKYVQPIKVVEIRPARHFTIDESGKKVPIEAPEDWVMPPSLQPTRSEDIERDIQALRVRQRHYVVDEENPRGKLEKPIVEAEQGMGMGKGKGRETVAAGVSATTSSPPTSSRKSNGLRKY